MVDDAHPTDLRAALETVRRLVLDSASLIKATAGGRQRGVTPTWRQVELRPVELKSGLRLQVVTFDDRQSFTRNEEWSSAGAVVDALLAEPFSHWHVVTTTVDYALRVTKAGRVLVQERESSAKQETSHDRVKRRLVDPDEAFLRVLGVTTADGQVKPSRRDKFQQVEQFIRLLDADVREAQAGGRLRRDRLRVVDLGCGNAYLTFAAYRHLTSMGLSVELVGVDLKKQALEHNTDVVLRLGWDDDVRFVESSILAAKVEQPVDVVLALHACDTATDEALARAVEWQADVVLAAPCCHHDLQRQLAASAPPEGFGLVTRHGLLRERLGDVLTDALRAWLMRSAGYRTDVVEFVDSQHTPRNAMLRAHRTGAPPSAEQQADYHSLTTSFHLTPHLATLLPPPK